MNVHEKIYVIMAMLNTSLRQRLKSIATCDICEGLLDNPQEWPCLHHSCSKCLPEEKGRDSGTCDQLYILCPKCDSRCTRDEIKHKAFLEGIVMAVKQEESGKECVKFQVASENEADEIAEGVFQSESSGIESFSNTGAPEKHSKSKFNTLGESLTEADLSKATLRQTKYGSRALQRHKTLPVGGFTEQGKTVRRDIVYELDDNNETADDSVITFDTFCENHEDNKVIYYCMTCKELICAKCRYVSHPKHLVLKVKEAFTTEKDSVMNKLKWIQQYNDSVERQITKIEALEEAKRNHRKDMLAKISDAKAKALARVESDFTVLSSKIEERFNSNMVELESAKSVMKKCHKTNDKIYSWTSSLLGAVGGPEILLELKSDLIEKVTSTIDQLGLSGMDDIYLPDKYHQFSQYTSGCNVIGSLTDVSLSETDFETVDGDQLSVCESQNRSDEETEKLPSAELDFRNISPFLLNNLHKDTAIQIRSFKPKNWCHRLCYFEGKIWCPSCFSSVIDIYDISGLFVRSVMCKGADSCRSIHPVKRHQVIVAAKKGLFVIDTETQKQMKLYSGTFRDVSANQEVIVAVQERGAFCDTVHVLSTGDFAPRHTFTLGSSFCKRLIVKGDELFVSFHEPYKQSYVSVYKLDGTEIFKSGIHGRGVNKVDCPLLGCIDGEDNVLVADVYNSYIQVMDRKGNWSRVTQQSKHPYDALIIDGEQMLLLCNDNASTRFNVVGGSHIYVYQL